jgi:hypothetical protein
MDAGGFQYWSCCVERGNSEGEHPQGHRTKRLRLLVYRSSRGFAPQTPLARPAGMPFFARARDRSGQQKPAGFLLERIARFLRRSRKNAPKKGSMPGIFRIRRRRTDDALR